jgi:hypothetical protein
MVVQRYRIFSETWIIGSHSRWWDNDKKYFKFVSFSTCDALINNGYLQYKWLTMYPWVKNIKLQQLSCEAASSPTNNPV